LGSKAGCPALEQAPAPTEETEETEEMEEKAMEEKA